MTGNAEFITYGGVKLDRNSISKMETKVCKNYYEKECKFFNVEFQNGIKISYPQQEISGSYVTTSQQAWGDTNTDIYGIMGLELKGTKYADNIYVKHGEIESIDVSGDGGRDYVEVENVTGPEFSTDMIYDHVRSNLNLLGLGTITVDTEDNTSIHNLGQEEPSRYGTPILINLSNKFFGVSRHENN